MGGTGPVAVDHRGDEGEQLRADVDPLNATDFQTENLFGAFATQALAGKAYQTPELAGVFSGYQINVPQLFADVDRVKAKQMGVPLATIYQTLQINLGSLYVNDFNQFGRTYQVRVQADAEFRSQRQQIEQLKVRSDKGEMIPLSSLMRINRLSSAGTVPGASKFMMM